MRIGITGGSGSLGTAIINRCLTRQIGPIVVMSRDEVKTDRMNQRYGGIAGEVRAHTIPTGLDDIERMREIFEGCEVLIHAAAAKRVDQFTYGSADTMLRTNVLGTRNVLRMAVKCGIKRVLIISSDKASSPINPYGMSKALAEALAVEANAFSVPRGTLISVARWGNCMGSRGSVLHLWRRQAEAGGPLKITDLDMTRFWITLEDAVGYLFDWLKVMRGGEIFVPVLRAAYLTQIAAEVAPGMDIEAVGLRPGGEKLNEQLLNEEEVGRMLVRNAERADEIGDYFIVTPSVRSWSSAAYPWPKAKIKVPYRSDTWPMRLDPEQIRAMIDRSPKEDIQ